MTTKKCNSYNDHITWSENYTKRQRPLNLDGSVHSCISKSSKTTSNQTSLPDIVDGHTRLFAKMIQRIEILEKRNDKK